jgi:hypothetical protein
MSKMTYSFHEMQGFFKECRKNRTATLEKLAHDNEWTIYGFSNRASFREDRAKAAFHIANDLNKPMKWIE